MNFLRFVVIFCLLNGSAQGFGAPHRRPRIKPSFSTSVERPTEKERDTRRGARHRQRWGVDKGNDEEYWFNSEIHSLGNTGFMGALHAALAPVATTLIDNLAYDGVNVRQLVGIWYTQSKCLSCT